MFQKNRRWGVRDCKRRLVEVGLVEEGVKTLSDNLGDGRGGLGDARGGNNKSQKGTELEGSGV
jgi:hypothetical protein